MTTKDITNWLDELGIDYNVAAPNSEAGNAEFISGRLYDFIEWQCFVIENEGFAGAFKHGKMYISEDENNIERAFAAFKKDMLANIKRYKHLKVVS